MRTAVTIIVTLAVLSALRAIHPILAYTVGIFALGWCLARLYGAGVDTADGASDHEPRHL